MGDHEERSKGNMEIDNTFIAKGEEQGKTLVVIMAGAPGSGKSTFCDHVMRSSTRQWVRICQDTINKGKSGTKIQCLASAASALKGGKSVLIDRCNLDREQRAEFVKLGGPQVDVHAVVLDLPARLCISRSVKRTQHEGHLQGGRAAAVVNRMLQKKELPKLGEGFTRITFCQNESDVQAALNTYCALGQFDSLPHGCFGQKIPEAKIQHGIMKFFKKVDIPADAIDKETSAQDSVTPHIAEEQFPCCKVREKLTSLLGNTTSNVEEDEVLPVGCVRNNACLSEIPTLAFPSISTSDFYFNHEKASDIIVEQVEKFMNKLENARLVLVDLTHKSKILSLVKAKAAQKNIDSSKFFTFVGDITQLYSAGGLRCNVIANAANWRLKPGGGGVNASIFSAAGPSLESATKEQAKSLLPGNALVVPLPSTSPLYSREGVTHVIHVLGPNMNPQRPNYLNNDYVKGCEILRKTYTSLFEGFASILRTQPKLTKGKSENLVFKPPELQTILNSDEKIKREGAYESDRNKKCKRSPNELAASNSNSGVEENSNNDNMDRTITKAWGSWAQALYHIAIHPETHKGALLEILDDVIVLNDLYPKAQRHLLVLARCEDLDCLADVCNEHLQLLKTMHSVGVKWAEKFMQEDPSLVFRLGYHSAPSMRQLHLHVISQDFNSKHLKNKKHWNSFNTAFFRDSVDVIEEVSNCGKATLKDDENFQSMELRCHRCRSAHPNIPRLKSHIINCQAPYPAALLQNGRLFLGPSNIHI